MARLVTRVGEGSGARLVSGCGYESRRSVRPEPLRRVRRASGAGGAELCSLAARPHAASPVGHTPAPWATPPRHQPKAPSCPTPSFLRGPPTPTPYSPAALPEALPPRIPRGPRPRAAPRSAQLPRAPLARSAASPPRAVPWGAPAGWLPPWATPRSVDPKDAPPKGHTPRRSPMRVPQPLSGLPPTRAPTGPLEGAGLLPVDPLGGGRVVVALVGGGREAEGLVPPQVASWLPGDGAGAAVHHQDGAVRGGA